MLKTKTLNFLDVETSREELSSECAKTHLEGNAIKLLAHGVLTKFGDACFDVKTIIVWVLSALGVPMALVSLAAPIRESGSLIPQFFMVPLVKSFKRRKTIVALALVSQAIFIAAFALLAVTESDNFLGVLALCLIALVALSRSATSVGFKDLLAKSVGKSSRGKVMGLASSVAGVSSIGLGLLVLTTKDATVATYAVIIAVGAGLFLMASVVCLSLKEQAEPDDEGHVGDFIKNVNDALNLMKDRTFRHFVVTRAFLMSAALTSPYIVMLTYEQTSALVLDGLALFLMVSGAAYFLGGPFLGLFSDWSSKWLMVFSAMLTAAICGGLLVYLWVFEGANAWVFLVLFFVQSLAHQAARLARKTYVINIAGEDNRTLYVGASNGIMGVLLLVFGLASAWLTQVSTLLGLTLFLVAALIAGVLAVALKDN